jgi:sugar lactone lactonase YvrE
MKASIWDSHQNFLGEGPVAYGPGNNQVAWVDILRKTVHEKNFASGSRNSFTMEEDISFVIPRTQGGFILGTVNGPLARDVDGKTHALPIREETSTNPTRWNDAKVSPYGDLWLGTMAYGAIPNEGALYKLNKDSSTLSKEVTGITISNGLAWSADKKTMFYIDTMTFGIDAFDFQESGISNRRRVWQGNDAEFGAPDGMCIDTDDGLWVAFWGGSCVRRFDSNFKITELIEIPAPHVTSCAFVGPDLKTLIITSAHNGDTNTFPEAGMTFMATPGVTGTKSTLFPS